MPPARLLMTAVSDGVFQIALAFGFAAAVDQAGAAHVTVRHLVAAEIDRMIAGQFGVNALVQFAVARAAGVQRFEAAVVLRQLLLDDVGLDGHAQMIRLAGEIGGDVIISCPFLKALLRR